MLALVHHLVVTSAFPLAEVVALAADLTTDLAIVEFVGPGDPMFRRLLRGRERLYEGITEAAFESRVRERFEVLRREPLEGSERTLYVLWKRPVAVSFPRPLRYHAVSHRWDGARGGRTGMASTVWKGFLTFGLISVPVRLFAAARREHVSFHQIHKPCGTRIASSFGVRTISAWSSATRS